jgi:hypothetical protein
VSFGSLLTLAEQIQVLGQTGKTGEIRVTSEPGDARLNLLDGEVVDARTSKLEGVPAAIELINLPSPQTEFIVGKKPERRTINVPFLELLYEAARARDEGGARNGAAAPEPPEELFSAKAGSRSSAPAPGAGANGARPTKPATTAAANTTTASLPPKPASVAAAQPLPQVVPPAIPAPSTSGAITFKLTLELDGKPLPFTLKGGISAIGRAPDNDITIAEPSVSNRHAFVAVEGRVIIVRDLGSTNGTFVNGTRIDSCQLKPGDKVIFGRVSAVVVEG